MTEKFLKGWSLFYEHVPFGLWIGIGTLRLAVILQWLPEPENAVKGAIMALITGTCAALAKWGVDSFRNWIGRKP